MKRFLLVLTLLACIGSCAGFADSTQENPLDGMKHYGSSDFRRYGFLIYSATLWAAGNDPTQPPLAIRLTYKRAISADAIVNASIDEMRKLDVAHETLLALWRAQMKNIFPDVRAGDHILGVHDKSGARFFFNGKFIGAVDNPEFANAFFGIWLNPKTSAPDLRNALLTAASP